MQKLLAYLQLMRLPAVFTAMGDIVLGYLLTHSSPESLADFAWLLGASSCLYLSGMVFNDVFDRRIDAQERPGRPIPSGRVPLRSAVVLGIALMSAGIAAAAAVGANSLFVAGLLALAVLAYDGVLKKTPLGPPAMGACRFLNVILGASAAESAAGGLAGEVWAMPQLQVAAGMGIYILGVTWFARSEAGRSPRGQLAAAMAGVNLGLAVLLHFVATWPGKTALVPTLLVLAVIILTINRRLAAAVFDPAPAKVQAAIKMMLMSLIMLDATLVVFATGVAAYGIATAALLVPGLVLSRWISVT